MTVKTIAGDAESARPAVPVLDFLDGLPPDQRVTGLLAQALYRQNQASFAGLAPQEIVVQARRQADAELASHAIRYLHNRVEDIKAEAIRERLVAGARPTSFLRLVLAALVAFCIGSAGVIWITAHGLLPTLMDAATQARLPG